MSRLVAYLAALGAVLGIIAVAFVLQFPELAGRDRATGPVAEISLDRPDAAPPPGIAPSEPATAAEELPDDESARAEIAAALAERLPTAPSPAPPPAAAETGGRTDSTAIDKEAALRQLRNVTPGGVLPGPAVTGPLTRVPGPPPPELVKLPPRPTRLYLIVVEQAGIVRSKDQRVSLAGVEPTPLEATCRDAVGDAVPCGRQAAMALARFIRKRAIDCHYGEEDREGRDVPRDVAVPAECTLGKQNVAEWLVSGGWARAAGDAPQDLKDAEEAARKDGRGLWQYETGLDG